MLINKLKTILMFPMGTCLYLASQFVFSAYKFPDKELENRIGQDQYWNWGSPGKYKELMNTRCPKMLKIINFEEN